MAEWESSGCDCKIGKCRIFVVLGLMGQVCQPCTYGKTRLEEMSFSIMTFCRRQILLMFLSLIQNHSSLRTHRPLNAQNFVQPPFPISQSKPGKHFIISLNSSFPANHYLSSAYFFFKMSLAPSLRFPHYFTPGSLKGFQLDFLFLVLPKSFKLKIT